MRQSFSVQRLVILIRINFVENGRNYLLMGGVLVALLLIMMLPVCFFDTYNNPAQLLQFAAVPIVVILGSSLYTSHALTQYAAGSKGMLSLMSPATSLEKFLSSLIVNLLFLIPFLLFFLLLHHQTITFGNRRIPANGMQYSFIARGVLIYIGFSYFLFHSVFFLGSIYFTRSSYVKTFASLIFVMLTVGILNSLLAKYLASYPLMMSTVPMAGWSIVRDAGLKVYRIPFPDKGLILLYLTLTLTTLGLWLAAYQRLREKQI
ncbi:hypothetical protein [Salmonirosea aquatica]|uniref:Uncharacterized protein n=1 Tax=Salmonirosea aquatica TaxID=2654236 RepID=A0A7C9F1W9_9BACT|nr:hypothetical protein [Cytophagaceae bacterium SJW1-29]